ncbi:hypothetical protein [Trueperella sp. LYQ143]|uniref:hypothetical protein n=1 Tax=Trueperella sp. LYQ143 TaxID=3391059 RepID=UPI003982F814
MSKRRNAYFAASIIFLLSTITTAYGLSYTGTKYGSEIHTNGSFISLKDNQDDNQFPSVNYSFDQARQSSGFSNKSGYNTTVTMNAPAEVNGIQPCVSRYYILPSNCGGWIGTPPK